MGNHTAVARAVVAAGCTLVYVLLPNGIGVNLTWAGSDQLPHLKLSSSTYQVDFQPVLPSGRTPLSNSLRNSDIGPKLAQICSPTHTVCPPGDNDHCCDKDMACRYTIANQPNSESLQDTNFQPARYPLLQDGIASMTTCVSGVCANTHDAPNSPTGKVGICQ
jgi:hypothetical protein